MENDKVEINLESYQEAVAQLLAMRDQEILSLRALVIQLGKAKSDNVINPEVKGV